MASKYTRDMVKKAMEENGGGGKFEKVAWFTLKNDQDTSVIRFLHAGEDDLEIHKVHVFDMGKFQEKVICYETQTCPYCVAGNRAQLKVFMHLIDSRDNSYRIWERPQGFIPEMYGLLDEYGDLNNRNYKVLRVGNAGDTKTKYQFFGRDKDTESIRDLPARKETIGWVVKTQEQYEKSLARQATAPTESSGAGESAKETKAADEVAPTQPGTGRRKLPWV